MFLYVQCVFELAVSGTPPPVYCQSSGQVGYGGACGSKGHTAGVILGAWGPAMGRFLFSGSYQDDMPFILEGIRTFLLYIYQALSEFHLAIIFFILPRSLLGLSFHLHG